MTTIRNKKIQSEYDITVIGGGIQGAGIALVARQAGYSVLLIEKNQWASGTSSKSSKLIHGGLRYLQTGQFKLVYECLAERKWMLETLPDLVKSNWFAIPVYKNSQYGSWKIHLGLWLYRLLSWNPKYSQYKRVPKSQWNTLSGLSHNNLVAVYAYQDAQTDDAELTRRVVARANEIGVDCFEETEFISGQDQQDGNILLSLKTKDHVETKLNSTIVVNATGPWVNETLQKINPTLTPLPIDLVQGSHLVVSPQLSSTCFYLEAPQDGRAVFCLPWKGKTMLGTTELHHKGSPEEAKVTKGELDYLCDVVKHHFPSYHFTVESKFCGLRVLPQSNQKAFLRPRDTTIKWDDQTLSLYGGKLTGWRSTADKVVNLINQRLNKKISIDIDKLF